MSPDRRRLVMESRIAAARKALWDARNVAEDLRDQSAVLDLDQIAQELTRLLTDSLGKV